MEEVERIRRALPQTHRYITGTYGQNSMNDYDETGEEYRGPHPKHGSSSWPDGQGNFSVNTKTGEWYCFRAGHKAGGNIFEWIAVDEGLVNCGRTDDLGAVFPDVLEIAADEAGVEFNPDIEDKKEVRKLREEAELLTSIYEDATRYYHENLTAAMRSWVKDKYGLSDATIDAVGIGFAPADDADLQRALDYNEVEMLKSGLVIDTNDGIKDFYTGRVVFPYWSRGKVQYFAGRKTPNTPDVDWEQGKYKKMLTSQNKGHVSDLVEEPIFGRDSAIGADRVIVTEGVTDVLSAWEAGYSCISPVTTQFKVDRVRDAAKLLNGKQVCVVMDEDPDSGAGLQGAAKTVRHIEKFTGPETQVGVWRLSFDGMDDGDLCEYLYDYEPPGVSQVAKASGIDRGEYAK